MKKLNILFILLVTSCIIKTPNRQEVDYAQRNDLAAFKKIHPEIHFIELSKEYFDRVLTSNNKFHIELIATWCPICYSKLMNGSYRNQSDSSSIIVHVNDNIKGWDKFNSSKLPETIFFLSSDYGFTEKDKIFNLVKHVCDTCELRYALPQKLIINNH